MLARIHTHANTKSASLQPAMLDYIVIIHASISLFYMVKFFITIVLNITLSETKIRTLIVISTSVNMN